MVIDTGTLASLPRRLACLIYEALLAGAIAFIASFLFLLLPPLTDGWQRPAHQAWLLTVLTLYFVVSWRNNGQTLAMKTWKIRLVGTANHPFHARRALLRAVLAILGGALLGAGFFWALIDRDGQFLHDRLAGTRLVNA